MENKTDTLDMTADIVSAFVGNNSVPASELPALIQSVYQALNAISSGEETKVEAPKAEGEALCNLARQVMEAAPFPVVNLSVPLTVEAKAGSSWGAAH